jgi:hypothetical protein
MLPEAMAQVRQQAVTGPCPGFIGLQRKGPERRSIATDLIFGSFHQGKEQSQPAVIERADLQFKNISKWCVLIFT